MGYIHERSDWPRFRWDAAALAMPLADIGRRQARLIGCMEGVGVKLREEGALAALSEEVIKSSEIEGERLDPEAVRSSMARQLGFPGSQSVPPDRTVDGAVEILLDATRRYSDRLTQKRLFGWHSALFPDKRSGLRTIAVGAWRKDAAGPMQVVSGPLGKRRIHFEAPAALRVPAEMRRFLAWFEEPVSLDSLVKAGLAHFWFVTIHPFEDGNGRIARAIAEMALARGEGSGQRFYSVSSVIRDKRNAYYQSLETAQRGELDVTEPLSWFIDSVGEAIDRADRLLSAVLAKSAFWDRHRATPLNDRQAKIVGRLLDNFEGKLTSSKWAKLAKVSQDTATRDINDLIEKKVLRKCDGGGRSTSYLLVL